MPNVKDSLDIGPGGEISTWPYQKVARARQHAHELIAAVDAWNARNLYRCPIELDQDRVSLRVIQVAMPNNPVADWALSFGDALHNVRVALDGLAWELAHLNGATPSDPSKVFFPIFESPERFKKAADRDYAHLHPRFVDRIRDLQPFMLDDPDQSWLSIIRRFDNDDKHRARVFTAPALSEASFHFGGMKMSEKVVNEGEPQIETRTPLTSIPVGEALAVINFGVEIAEFSPDAYAIVSTEAVVEIGNDVIPAAAIAMNAAHWATMAIKQICSAVIPDSGPVPIGPFVRRDEQA